ncbi:MAG: DUF2029 domain-containing protein [Chloroflexales bacterium]|nr:DUF2029 domain-containing protein [Chloroflexales bacterium]
MATKATRQDTSAFWHGPRVLPLLFNVAGVALSALAIAAYLYVALSRLTFPFALEWIEPASYSNVERVFQGQPLYAAPSYEFIPLIYTPLYFYVAAAVTWLINDVVLATRLVSLASSLAILGTLFGIARVRGLTRAMAALAAGLFALTYHVSGYWFDVSRVDTLFLALLLLAYLLAFVDIRPAWVGGALAGMAVVLAFMTKQHGALVAPFLAGYFLIRRDWSRAAGFVISVCLSAAVFLAVMDRSSGGWFWLYALTIPQSEPLAPQLQHDFWFVHVGPQFYPALLSIMGSLLILALARHWALLRGRLLFIGVFGAPLFIMSYLSMSKQWGYLNGLMPLTAAIALVTADNAQIAGPASDQPPVASARPAVLVAGWLVSLLILLQFPLLRYDVATAIPSREDRAAGERLVERLRGLEGPIYGSASPYLLVMAGHPDHFHPSPLSDLNIVSQLNPALKERLDPYMGAVTEPLTNGSVRVALLPDVRWYDQIFSAQNGYRCERLPADEQLRAVSGAPATLVTLCTRSP